MEQSVKLHPSPVDIHVMGAPALPPVLPPPLPGKKSRRKVVLCFSAVFIVVVTVVSLLKPNPLAGHEDKLKAIEALSALRYPDQISKAKPACTDKGFKVVQSLKQFFPASFNAVSAKSNPQFCDVEMFRDSAEGQTRIHVRLVKDNGWKFDDVFVNEANGKPCNQWASYACEHPFLSTLQFHSGEIMQGAKNTLDTTKDILEIIELFQKVNERDNRSY